MKWLRSSPQTLEKIREYARIEGMEGRPIVCLDVCTRWNSTYLLLDHAIKFSKAFDMLSLSDLGFQDYFKEHNNTRCPDAIDWENANGFVSYLKVFYEATLKSSASKTPASHLLFKQLLNIQALLAKELKNPTDDPLHKVATSMKIKYEKYWRKWENINLFIYLVVVLDPRYKLRYLSFELNNIGVDKEKVKKL